MGTLLGRGAGSWSEGGKNELFARDKNCREDDNTRCGRSRRTDSDGNEYRVVKEGQQQLRAARERERERERERKKERDVARGSNPIISFKQLLRAFKNLMIRDVLVS